MTQNIKKLYTIGALAVLALIFIVFSVSRWSQPKISLPLGSVTVVDGRVDARISGARDWAILSEGDKISTGTEIRIGEGASTTIHDDHHLITLSPNTTLNIKGSPGTVDFQLENGELKIETTSHELNHIVTTEFGQIQLTGDTTITATRPAGKSYCVVIVLKGAATFNDADARNKNSTKITAEMGTKVLSTSTQHALWSVMPGPEDVITGKEGFAAVSLRWEGFDKPGNVLLRNLSNGEMVTHENVSSGFEVTLPAGTYSWVVNSDGSVTAPRRFHITGQSSEAAIQEPKPAVSPEPAPSTEETKTETPKTEEIKTETPKTEEIKTETTKTEEIKNKEATTEEPKTDSLKEPPPVTAANKELPKLKLIEPKKGSQIPVSAIAEKRVTWSVETPADSLELEILGSSGNPSLHLTLEGTRSRQKLTTLPPGRYTVRVRGIIGSGETSAAGAWTESFFDVIQTKAGQMAPTDVKASITSSESLSKLVVSWKKSPAPQYQVRVISAGEPATIIRSKKPKVSMPAPKNGTAIVSVCALDANLHIRGCAPDVNVP